MEDRRSRQVPGRGGERPQGRCSRGYGVSLGYLHKGFPNDLLSKTAPLVAKASSDAVGSGGQAQHPLSAPIQTSEHKYQYWPHAGLGCQEGQGLTGVRHRPAKQLHLDGAGAPSTHPAQLWRCRHTIGFHLNAPTDGEITT